MKYRRPPVQSAKYIRWLRTQPCVISGFRTSSTETVEAAHIGNAGKGMKSDDEALPLRHSLHAQGHQSGEVSMWREKMPDWLLRECIRSYARERYRQWEEHGEWI